MIGYLTPDRRPTYREYFPSFSLTEGRRAMSEGRDICQFNLGAGMVGQLLVLDWRFAESLVLKLNIGMPYVKMQEAQEFALVPIATGIGSQREAVVCPKCGQPKLVIYCAPDWGCATCQGLLYRSQVVPPLVLKGEKLELLELEMRRGRPAGMHNSTYRKKREELLALRKAVRSKAVYASIDQMRVTRTQWLKASQVEDFWFNDYTVQGGVLRPRWPAR